MEETLSSCNQNTPLPSFPDEVILEIFSFVELKTLLHFRLCCRRWNVDVSSVLRKSPLPIIKFEKGEEDSMPKMLATFQARKEKVIPFASYQFSIIDGAAKLKAFLDVIGPHISSCTFLLPSLIPDSMGLIPLVTLVHKTMPNCKALRVEGFGINAAFLNSFPANSDSLPMVHTFEVRRCYSAILPRVDFKVLQGWVSSLPALRILRFLFCVKMNSQMELRNFLNSYRHLKLIGIVVSIEQETLYTEPQLSNLPNLEGVKLELGIENSNGHFLTNLGVPLFQCDLEHLRLKLDDTAGLVELPELSNLPLLEVRCASVLSWVKFWEKNSTSKLPLLHTVCIFFESAGLENVGMQFEPLRFESVRTLGVHAGFDVNGIPCRPYHLIFPNVTNLVIRGVMLKVIVDYICEYFPTIGSLSLISLDTAMAVDDILFVKTKDNDKEIKNRRAKTFAKNYEWALNRLTCLKNLRLNSPDMTDVAVGIGALTQAKRIPPYDQLSFNGVHGIQRLLFDGNTWHNNVAFSFQ